MMRCTLGLLFGLQLAAASHAYAASINFDNIPGGIPPVELPANFTPLATFSTEPGALLLVFSGADMVGSSAPNNLTAGFNPTSFPYDADVYVDFTPPVNDLTFRVTSDNQAGVIATVRVFHGGGSNVELDVVGNGNIADSILMDLTAYQDVSRIEIVNITDEFGLSYDDFNVADVPEPASGMLLAFFALAGMLGRQRR